MQLLAVCSLDISKPKLPFDSWSICCSDIEKKHNRRSEAKENRMDLLHYKEQREHCTDTKNLKDLKDYFTEEQSKSAIITPYI